MLRQAQRLLAFQGGLRPVELWPAEDWREIVQQTYEVIITILCLVRAVLLLLLLLRLTS